MIANSMLLKLMLLISLSTSSPRPHKFQECFLYPHFDIREINGGDRSTYKKISESNKAYKLHVGVTEVFVLNRESTDSFYIALDGNIKDLKLLNTKKGKLGFRGYKFFYEGRPYYIANELFTCD
jgi:hypothetical protein